ncbi:hypothetical protein GALL_128830 [mine drainage metagenome]|uniref:MG2 domain protein n=1 Tax=mine drainage metagenome TaxID=410659 RepID=A0A1J5SAT0_9ZZZZ
MQKFIRSIAASIIFICCGFTSSAQKIDSVLGIYNERFQSEKIHIHFDKSVYNPGETIWMKVYLMAGTDFSDYSKNIYIDWFGTDGKLIKHTVAPVFESTARLQFDIPASYQEASIHAIAYTRWMLNFDTAFLFNKEIPVIQIKQPIAKKVQQIRSLHFFPEGGDLVTGLQSRVAFKANDQFGKPVKVTGAVRTASGVFVDSFVSEHDGMGSFALLPKKDEKYIASWKDETGETHITDLPVAIASGINMEIHPLVGRILVALRRTVDVPENLKQLNMVATVNQQLVYRSRINFSEKISGLAQIPTAELPTGVMLVTLFDANWIPVAERIVFVNNQQHQFFPRVSFPVVALNKRAKNVIEIDVPDTVASNLSIAVTDANIITDSSNNIISQLLLCSDIKGYVHNPAYYFSSTVDSVAQQLDLVMLTNGWRRFKWNEIVAGKLPNFLYPRETEYVMIKGKVFGGGFQKTLMKPSINLLISGKDSTKQFLSLPIDKDAAFENNHGIFFDTLSVNYIFNGDRKFTDIATVRFNNGLLPELPISKNYFQRSFLLSTLADSAAQRKIRMMIDEQERLKKLSASATLKEVIVRAKTKSATQILDEKYTSGLFAGSDAYQFDIANDLIAQSAYSVFNYLQGRVAGLTVNYNNGQQDFTWRNSKPDLFLNEMPTDVSMLANISMTDVAYIKVFRPPFFGAIGGGSGGAIAIYTRKGNERTSVAEPHVGMPKSFVAGYTKYKEFYSPDYTVPQPYNDVDSRTTLYWNPYVFTDPKNHKVRLTFFNNDSSKKLRVVIEGVNADGKFARVEKLIE